MIESFKNKRALVTGAQGGIGACLTKTLTAHGAHVFGVDQDDGDLQDPAYADALPKRALDALGGLDLVFNNAGLFGADLS